jgi:hypothetical protein
VETAKSRQRKKEPWKRLFLFLLLLAYADFGGVGLDLNLDMGG